MTSINLKQGEDIQITVPVFDKDGLAVDFTTANNAIVTLTSNNITLAKYDLLGSTGYEQLSISSTGNHILEFDIIRSTSKNFTIGYLQVNVLVNRTNDSLDPIIDENLEYNYPDYLLINKGYIKDL